nr:DNA polymerase delta subunit like [Ipomoea batatas]
MLLLLPNILFCFFFNRQRKLTAMHAEAKQEFKENCSVQVYSVQACIPKDPAALWNSEFVQAEELFKQPHLADNCLWDNRFCGVLNSSIKWNAERTSISVSAPQLMTSRMKAVRKENRTVNLL